MTHINQRRDTSANWTSTNPVLQLGEVGWETNTLKAKLGDGVSAWDDLDYAVSPPQDLSTYALLADPEFIGNPKAPTAAPGDADTTIANTAFVAEIIATSVVDGDTTHAPSGEAVYTAMAAVPQASSVVATANQANSTVTPAVLTGQTFTILPGRTLRLTGNLIVQSAATTTGPCYGIRVVQPSGASGGAQGAAVFSGSEGDTGVVGSAPTSQINVAANSSVFKEFVGSGISAANSNAFLAFDVIIKNQAAAHSTTVTLEFRSEVAASAVTAQIGTSAFAIFA